MRASVVRRSPRRAVPGWVVLLPCLLSACATLSSGPKPPPDLAALCNEGRIGACESWGAQLLGEGKREEAAAAYGRACQEEYLPACMTEGRLRMEQGDLDGAEPPFRKTYEANLEEGALALADLQTARGDDAGAERLRYEALAIDKSVVEFVMAYRVGLYGASGVALDLNVQPMAFLARRLNVGVNLTVAGRQTPSVTLNGYAGYQYFVTDWAAPYGRLLAGSQWTSRHVRPDVGMEAGMKLFAGPVGHVAVGFGSSLVGSTYLSLEVGLDWLLTLAILAQAH